MTTIISPSFPYTFINGTVEDATQVNTNFQAVATQVNANAAANGVNSDITALNGGAGLGIPIAGTATNNNATLGKIGEYISSTVLIGSAVALTSLVAADITSVSLTAGDWDCTGITSTSNAGATMASYAGWISAVSATLPTIPNNGAFGNYIGSGATPVVNVGTARFSLSTTTTLYLSGLANFTGGLLGGYGFIRCRRMR